MDEASAMRVLAVLEGSRPGILGPPENRMGRLVPGHYARAWLAHLRRAERTITEEIAIEAVRIVVSKEEDNSKINQARVLNEARRLARARAPKELPPPRPDPDEAGRCARAARAAFLELVGRVRGKGEQEIDALAHQAWATAMERERT